MLVAIEEAERALAAGKRKSDGLSTQMRIAVVNSDSMLEAFVRMDDAWLGSVDVAL